MTKKVALITGVTGQDGAYLAEILLSKGYVVHGIKRPHRLTLRASITFMPIRMSRTCASPCIMGT